MESEQSKEPESKVRYKVPEGYLEEDRHTVQDLLERISRLDEGQEELDAIYTEMADVMKAGLVQVRKEERGDVGGNLGSLRRLLHREGVSIKQKHTG